MKHTRSSSSHSDVSGQKPARVPSVTPPEACWQLARDWLWRQRQNAPANADMWDLRWRWLTGNKGERLYRQVTAGLYEVECWRHAGMNDA